MNWFRVVGVSVLLLTANVVPLVGQKNIVLPLAVNRSTIEERLNRFALQNESRETSLKGLFEEAGCRDEKLTEQTVPQQKVPNLICTLPGTSNSTIILGAHTDHVDVGQGVVDNWSGAALLPSVFQALSAMPRIHTIEFIGFTAEEKGLIGSKFFVTQLGKANAKNITLMINLDSVGVGPTQVWLTHSDQKSAKLLNALAYSLHISLGATNADQVGDDDSTSFREKHIPTLMLHSLSQGTLGILHTPKDTIDKIDIANYYDTYRLLVAYLGYIDALPDRASPE